MQNHETKLAEVQALGFSTVAEARDHLVWLINNGSQEFLHSAVRLTGYPYLRVGQRFTLKTDETDTDQNSEVCQPKKPETPEVPKTDKPVVELPKTGLDLSAMSLVGAGALTYAGYAYIASRRG